MHPMWQSQFTQCLTYQSFESTHWRETILVQPMWQGIFNQQLPYQSFVNTHWVETISMQPLWQPLQTMENLPNIYKHTLYREKPYQYSECIKTFSHKFYIMLFGKTYFYLKFIFYCKLRHTLQIVYHC